MLSRMVLVLVPPSQYPTAVAVDVSDRADGETEVRVRLRPLAKGPRRRVIDAEFEVLERAVSA